MHRPSASMRCFARLSSLALLMHAGRGDAASEAVCTSSHDGDSTTEGCFGWCMEAYQADHCTYCKCKGCHFCKAGAAADVSAATSTSMTALGQATRSSDVEGDSSSKDCQPFCNAAFSNDHCHMCKCKACECAQICAGSEPLACLTRDERTLHTSQVAFASAAHPSKAMVRRSSAKTGAPRLSLKTIAVAANAKGASSVGRADLASRRCQEMLHSSDVTVSVRTPLRQITASYASASIAASVRRAHPA